VLLMAGNFLAWLLNRGRGRVPEGAPQPLPSLRRSGWPVFHR
jgi:hypothetical protein